MPIQALDLLQSIPDPFVLLTPSGETLEANQAFRDLADRYGVSPRLAELVGEDLSSLLRGVAQDGVTREILPLAVGAEPRPWFRVTLSRAGSDPTFAALLVPVSDEAALRSRELEHHREIEMLKNVGAALAGTTDLDTLTERIYEQTARVDQTANFYVALYDRDERIVSFPRYLEDGVWRDMVSRPFANGLTEYVLRTGSPLLLNRDVLEQAHALAIEPIGRPCRAWLGVPMAAEGQTIGVIAVQDYQHCDCYHPHDAEILGVIAGQAAAAITHVRLLAAARRAYLDLSESQARLLDVERNRGVTEAVGAMNHEINNPLAAIVGNAQLLLKRSDTLTPEVRAKIASIQEAARRIQGVTTKMSALIQATSAPYPSRGSIVDVHHSVAVGETCALFPESPERRGD